MPESDKIQKCIIINKDNLDMIEEGLENINFAATHKNKNINLHNLIETRRRIKEIREIVDKVDEVKVCWG